MYASSSHEESYAASSGSREDSASRRRPSLAVTSTWKKDALLCSRQAAKVIGTVYATTSKTHAYRTQKKELLLKEGLLLLVRIKHCVQSTQGQAVIGRYGYGNLNNAYQTTAVQAGPS